MHGIRYDIRITGLQSMALRPTSSVDGEVVDRGLIIEFQTALHASLHTFVVEYITFVTLWMNRFKEYV